MSQEHNDPQNSGENQPGSTPNETQQGEKYMRTVRSFVVRGGRMTEGQERAYSEVWPTMGLDVEQGMLDLTEVFGREAPVVLEIGFGMGIRWSRWRRRCRRKTTSV